MVQVFSPEFFPKIFEILKNFYDNFLFEYFQDASELYRNFLVENFEKDRHIFVHVFFQTSVTFLIAFLTLKLFTPRKVQQNFDNQKAQNHLLEFLQSKPAQVLSELKKSSSEDFEKDLKEVKRDLKILNEKFALILDKVLEMKDRETFDVKQLTEIFMRMLLATTLSLNEMGVNLAGQRGGPSVNNFGDYQNLVSEMNSPKTILTTFQKVMGQKGKEFEKSRKEGEKVEQNTFNFQSSLSGGNMTLPGGLHEKGRVTHRFGGLNEKGKEKIEGGGLPGKGRETYGGGDAFNVQIFNDKQDLLTAEAANKSNLSLTQNELQNIHGSIQSQIEVEKTDEGSTHKLENCDDFELIAKTNPFKTRKESTSDIFKETVNDTEKLDSDVLLKNSMDLLTERSMDPQIAGSPEEGKLKENAIHTNKEPTTEFLVTENFGNVPNPFNPFTPFAKKVSPSAVPTFSNKNQTKEKNPINKYQRRNFNSNNNNTSTAVVEEKLLGAFGV